MKQESLIDCIIKTIIERINIDNEAKHLVEECKGVCTDELIESCQSYIIVKAGDCFKVRKQFLSYLRSQIRAKINTGDQKICLILPFDQVPNIPGPQIGIEIKKMFLGKKANGTVDALLIIESNNIVRIVCFECKSKKLRKYEREALKIDERVKRQCKALKMSLEQKFNINKNFEDKPVLVL